MASRGTGERQSLSPERIIFVNWIPFCRTNSKISPTTQKHRGREIATVLKRYLKISPDGLSVEPSLSA